MTTPKPPTKRRSRYQWTGDAFMAATIEMIEESAPGTKMGSANVVRLLLNTSEEAGLVNAVRLQDHEKQAFKALLFDEFFRVYGESLPMALAMLDRQRDRAKRASEKRKSASRAGEVLRVAKALVEGGKSGRSVASITAMKLNLSDRYVRAVLMQKKAEVPPG